MGGSDHVGHRRSEGKTGGGETHANLSQVVNLGWYRTRGEGPAVTRGEGVPRGHEVISRRGVAFAISPAQDQETFEG